MEQTPDFTYPPIIEFVLGVQFAPLENMTTGHLGLFWEHLGRDGWPLVGDEPPLDPQFELFDKPKWRVARQLQFKLQPWVSTWAIHPTKREGLDLGHEVSVREFLGMVSPDVKATWEKKQ